MSPRVSAERREQYLQERREQILNAAIQVFGKKGFDGANVADIARATGIAKGTVYLYFKSKQEIFSAILAERSLMPRLADLMADSDAPLEAMLTNIAENYLEVMDDYLPVFRLVLTDAHRFPAQAEQVYREIILRGNEMLATYLSAQAKAGRTRPLDDPFLTARAFIGMLTIYVLSQEVLGGKRFTPIERETWIREVVRLFLEGVRP